MTKRDDEQQAKIEKAYAETGQVPEGWVLDVVGESLGRPRFRKGDAGPEPAQPDDEPEE